LILKSYSKNQIVMNSFTVSSDQRHD